MDPFVFRLAESDHADYKRGDEEFRFDPDTLVRDLTAADLEALEAQLPDGYSLVFMLSELYGQQRARAVRTAFWVARRAAGVVEDYADFDPHVMRAQMRLDPAVTTDPPEPAESGSATSSETDGSATGSSTSPPA